MQLRSFLIVLGVVGVVVGCLGLLLPINLANGSSEFRCSQPFSLELSYAESLDRQNVYFGRPPSDWVGECKSAATFRKAWGLPVTIIGAVLLAGAVLVRKPSPPQE